jgi:hypothetical protein
VEAIRLTVGEAHSELVPAIGDGEEYRRHTLQARVPLEVTAFVHQGPATALGLLRLDLVFQLRLSQAGDNVRIETRSGGVDDLRGALEVTVGGSHQTIYAHELGPLLATAAERLIERIGPLQIPLIPPERTMGVMPIVSEVHADATRRQVSIGFHLRPAGLWESYVDRLGGDYDRIEMEDAEPALCQRACEADPRCRAWTYVRPDDQVLQAQCWLKDRVPTRALASCCISGVVPEYGVDRPGADFAAPGIDVPVLIDQGSLENCQSLCRGFAQCRAWTYVPPGVQGAQARCWLKNAIPDPVRDDCCVSGVN